MDRFRPFALPGYLILAMMVVFPLLDSALTVWPFRPSEVSWRFGAAGIMTRGLMAPLFGLILIYGLTLIYEHRLAQRAISIISGVAVLVLMAVSVLFVLDMLQMRAMVQPHMKTAFDVASLVALIKTGVVIVIGSVLAFAAFRSSRGTGPARRAESRGASGSTLINRESTARV